MGNNAQLSLRNSKLTPCVVLILSKNKVSVKDVKVGLGGGMDSVNASFEISVDKEKQVSHIPIQPGMDGKINANLYNFMTLGVRRQGSQEVEISDYLNVPLSQYKGKKGYETLVTCLSKTGQLVVLIKEKDSNWKCQRDGLGTTVKGDWTSVEYVYPNGHCSTCKETGPGYCGHSILTHRQTKAVKQGPVERF